MAGESIPRRTLLVRIALALLLALPAIVTRAGGFEPPAVAAMAVFGFGVLAAAILLMWAVETARADMSGALALALLALIAVLPEYAVDLYYAYAAGTRPQYAGYAAANMTGANRLLVGVGWVLVALAFAPAAVLGFIPALAAEIGWYISVVLIALYALYIVRISRDRQEDVEEFAGVPARLVRLPKRRRRLMTALGFALGAVIVLASASPFADALVEAGQAIGIDEFLLVQWLAPLASEAPELLVAAMFAWRLRDADAIGTLLSSKVNQWTLLIGTLPLAYRLGGGDWALPLDSRQTEEVLLTAAQTVLGLAFLIDLVFKRWEAAVLFALFAVQFVLPSETARLVLSGVYLAIGFSVLIARHRDLGASMATVVRTR